MSNYKCVKCGNITDENFALQHDGLCGNCYNDQFCFCTLDLKAVRFIPKMNFRCLEVLSTVQEGTVLYRHEQQVSMLLDGKGEDLLTKCNHNNTVYKTCEWHHENGTVGIAREYFIKDTYTFPILALFEDGYSLERILEGGDITLDAIVYTKDSDECITLEQQNTIKKRLPTLKHNVKLRIK